MARAPLRELHDEPQVGTVGELRGEARVREVQNALGVARSNRRADRLNELLGRARAERGPVTASRNVAALALEFSRSFHFALQIPGTHYSGLSNQQLLEVMESNGRPFAQDTPELRDHVRDRIADAFGTQEWDRPRALSVAARAVRDWIVKRIEEQGVDVELKPLNADYRAAKTSDGFDGRIGIKTRAWLGSVKNAAVEVA